LRLQHDCGAGASKGTGPCRMAPPRCSGRTPALPYPPWRQAHSIRPCWKLKVDPIFDRAYSGSPTTPIDHVLDAKGTAACRESQARSGKGMNAGLKRVCSGSLALFGLQHGARTKHSLEGVRSTPAAGGSEAINSRCAAADSESVRPILCGEVRAPLPRGCGDGRILYSCGSLARSPSEPAIMRMSPW